MAGATVIGSGVLLYKLADGDALGVRTGAAPMAGLTRDSGNARGSGTASGSVGATCGAGSSTMIGPAGS